MTLLCLLLLTTCLGGKPPDVPRYGWCKGNHEPNDPKPAQSGHDGYCKPCFRQLFPERYRAKQNARKRECEMCQEVKELVKGICKPCRRERKCHIDECDWINKEVGAARRWACTRTKFAPKNARLAMACPSHTSEHQRNSGLCSECFDRRQECHHCGVMDGVSLQQAQILGNLLHCSKFHRTAPHQHL